MSRRNARRRRRLNVSTLLLPTVLVVMAVGGLALVASSLGWLGGSDDRPRGRPPGTIAVPVVAVPISTYTRVRLEHLIDPRTGDLRAVYLPESSLLPETIIDAKELIGRVVATDKKVGQLFGQSDFFPPGTREGIVAGIPPGKRALRIDARKVSGIVGLGRGDRFDLVATLDYTRTAGNRLQVEGAPSGGLGSLGSRMGTSIVVEDGAVVQPLETRAVPGQQAQLVEEMVIAVAPDEVESLTRALHSGARIDCVPRSGRPVDVSAGPPAESSPRRSGGLNVVETITGGQRRVLAVPSGSDFGTPEVADADPRGR